MTASLFVSTMVQSIIEGTGLSLEMAAPFGDTMVQAALHCASSKGLPFSAACAPLATPIRMVVECQNCQSHCSYSFAMSHGTGSGNPLVAPPRGLLIGRITRNPLVLYKAVWRRLPPAPVSGRLPCPIFVTPLPVGSISTTRHSPSEERTIHQFAKAGLAKASEKTTIDTSLYGDFK